MSTKTDILLREIQEAVECNYISDLHTAQINNSAYESISSIPEQRYELKAWKEAVCYILGQKLNPESINEAKALLKGK